MNLIKTTEVCLLPQVITLPALIWSVWSDWHHYKQLSKSCPSLYCLRGKFSGYIEWFERLVFWGSNRILAETVIFHHSSHWLRCWFTNHNQLLGQSCEITASVRDKVDLQCHRHVEFWWSSAEYRSWTEKAVSFTFLPIFICLISSVKLYPEVLHFHRGTGCVDGTRQAGETSVCCHNGATTRGCSVCVCGNYILLYFMVRLQKLL